MGELSAQLSFDDFAGPPVPTDRYFFALFPPPEVASDVARIAQQLRSEKGLRGKALLTDRFHVTLLHLGDYAGERADIVAIASEMAARLRCAAFGVCFDRVASFKRKGGPSPLVLQGREGVQALVAFQRSMSDAMKRTSLHRLAGSTFTPHVTLLYDNQTVDEEPIPPVTWHASEFVLVHSLLGQTRHVVLGRWPLNADPKGGEGKP